MKFFTVCSGVEAVSLAWEPLGFEAVAFSEVLPFQSAVLAHHWPSVPNLGDLTKIDGKAWNGKVDILWGSTPCQAFALSGQRRGLIDPRGALSLAFANLADEMDPDFIVWENVKGVFSDKTNAFGCLLGALAGEDCPLLPAGNKWTHAGYVLGPKRTVAWRLFDAQYSGVPQRRERVFLVASPRGRADPRDILFEQGPRLQAPPRPRPEPLEPATPGSPKRAFAVAFRGRDGGEKCEVGDQASNCLRASQGGSDKAFALIDDGVDPHIRLLTPVECERLMAMPDDHTNIPWKGKPTSPDGLRYHAIGNSLNVLDVRWIGQRIQAAAGGSIPPFAWPEP